MGCAKMKKFVKLCSAILILFVVLTASALAAEVLYSGTCGGEGDGSNLTWTLDDEGTLRIEGKGRMKNYNWNGGLWYNYRSSIKSAVIGKGVTSIGNVAFSGCSSLTSVTIPSSVTSIGNSAFEDCSSLTSVTIPESVTSIGNAAFYGCSSLTVVTIPEGVTSIGDWAFSGCSSLTAVTIPEGVTRIGDRAFCNCSSLTSVTIPESVTYIDYDAFSGCSSLVSITVDENNAKYSSDERGVLFNKDKTTLFQYPAGNTATSYEIPSSVTSISNSAFSGCSSLTSVTIPKGVTSIGYEAFYGCSSLTSVTIPEGVTSIDRFAFSGCSSLTSVTIPEGVTSIDYAAFRNCNNLKSVYITDLVAWCKILFDVHDSNPLSNSADLYINGEKATNIEIPSSVTSSAFYGCSSLTAVTIPDGVTSIGGSVFSNCSNLMSVTIPSSVTSIRSSAFYGCSKLKNVFYLDTEEEWKNISIGSNNYCLTNATIHYNATILTPSVTRTADGTVYKVSAANLPVSSVVVVALYKDGRFVGYESAVYNGETLEIAADTPHDTATILAWSDWEKLIPLAPGTKIGS